WLPRSPLVRPGAFALGMMAVSTALAVQPVLAVRGLVFATVAFTLFLLVERLTASTFFRARRETVLVVLPAVVAVAYVVQCLIAWQELWRLAGTFVPPPL